MADKNQKSLDNLNRSGRTKGSKNKTTLFKEAMKEGFEKALEREARKVFDATVQCAIGPPSRDEDGNLLKDENGNQLYLNGDSTCKKMILDRIVPTNEVKSKGVSLGEGGLTIHIERLEANTATVDTVAPPIEITEAEYEEIDSGNG